MFEMGKLIVLLSTYLKLKFKSDPVYDLAINPNEIYPGASFITKTSSCDMLQTCLMRILVNKCLFWFSSILPTITISFFLSWSNIESTMKNRLHADIRILLDEMIRLHPSDHLILNGRNWFLERIKVEKFRYPSTAFACL